MTFDYKSCDYKHFKITPVSPIQDFTQIESRKEIEYLGLFKWAIELRDKYWRQKEEHEARKCKVD